MSAPQPQMQQIQVPSGFICITTYGPIRHETAACLLEARSFNEKNGLANLEYAMIPGNLVEKTRNEAARQSLRKGHGFCFYIDGDTTFEPNAIFRIIQASYGEVPVADIMGGWVPLRGELSLPTLDTGSGTWESIFPGSGIIEVMRTGGAFILVKRRVFEGLSDPWWRMRVPARPVDFMAEVDNWARMKLNGENPFRNLPDRPWERLEECARQDPSVVAENFIPVEVGEDSGLADRARNAGFRAFVQTDVACGHVDSIVRGWVDHRRAIDQMEACDRQAVGLLT